MKIYKKHILISLFLLIGLFVFTTDRVDASINWYGVQVECIYSDGGAYTFSYLQTDVDVYKSSVNRVTYNLVGTSSLESGLSSASVFVNNPVDNDHLCFNSLRIGSVTTTDTEGNYTVTTYYKFGENVDGTVFDENDGIDGGFWANIFGNSANQANSNYGQYTLVSERYILTDEAGSPDYTITYKASSTQATGSDSFAYIMLYDDIYLLKTKDRTTRLVEDTSHFDGITVNSNGEVTGIENKDTIYLNSPEVIATTDSTGVTSYSFNYNQIRYSISSDENETNNREYVLFNTGLGSRTTLDSELCESIPETTKVLKKIIFYIQILVPVFMIVLCAVDIGKIVISGNLDEELPKQKKKIIGRLVVGIIIFFLPLIVSLIINILQDSGLAEAENIKEISCLFE